jgi:4-aminobutyrate aminotransferase-like enzyme
VSLRELGEDGCINKSKADGVDGYIPQYRRKKTPDLVAAKAICAEAFKRGVYTLNMGSYGENAIRVTPPLIITEDQADTVKEILDASIIKVENARARSS